MSARRRALTTLVAALVVVSCTGAGPTDRVAPTPSRAAGRDHAATPTPAPTAPPAGPERSARVLAVPVRVDGPSASLAGLNSADTVVEYPRRRAGTAVVALTRETGGVVGPLRDATADDVAVARAWDAAIVTTVAAGSARRSGAVVAEEGAPPGVVVRDPARRAPHNAYAVIEEARALRPLRRQGRDEAGSWPTGPPPVAAGVPAMEVVVAAGTSSRVRWAYDPHRGAWVRGAGGGGAPAASQVDGVAVAVGTVVVAETNGGTAWRGAGPAVVLRAGRRHTARWATVAPGTPPDIERADGTPFPMAGTVWLHRCPTPCAQQIAPLTRRPDGAPR